MPDSAGQDDRADQAAQRDDRALAIAGVLRRMETGNQIDIPLQPVGEGNLRLSRLSADVYGKATGGASARWLIAMVGRQIVQ